MNEIFATKERQEILDAHGIKWKFDQYFNFVFESETDKKKAIKILKGHLEI